MTGDRPCARRTSRPWPRSSSRPDQAVRRPLHRHRRAEAAPRARPRKGSYSGMVASAVPVRREFLPPSAKSSCRKSKCYLPVGGEVDETHCRLNLGAACAAYCPPIWCPGRDSAVLTRTGGRGHRLGGGTFSHTRRPARSGQRRATATYAMPRPPGAPRNAGSESEPDSSQVTPAGVSRWSARSPR